MNDNSQKIKHIPHQTLILWGDQDTWTELEHAYKFEKDIQNSKLIVYPGVGHVPMEEIPDKSVEDVLIFLRDDADGYPDFH